MQHSAGFTWNHFSPSLLDLFYTNVSYGCVLPVSLSGKLASSALSWEEVIGSRLKPPELALQANPLLLGRCFSASPSPRLAFMAASPALHHAGRLLPRVLLLFILPQGRGNPVMENITLCVKKNSEILILGRRVWRKERLRYRVNRYWKIKVLVSLGRRGNHAAICWSGACKGAVIACRLTFLHMQEREKIHIVICALSKHNTPHNKKSHLSQPPRTSWRHTLMIHITSLLDRWSKRSLAFFSLPGIHFEQCF